MGLNIYVYNLGARDEEGNPTQCTWWDSFRYVGDRELWWDSGLEWQYRDEAPGEVLKRPQDFNAARAWVREHVPAGNQRRWLEALDLMETDPNLWLEGST